MSYYLKHFVRKIIQVLIDRSEEEDDFYMGLCFRLQSLWNKLLKQREWGHICVLWIRIFNFVTCRLKPFRSLRWTMTIPWRLKLFGSVRWTMSILWRSKLFGSGGSTMSILWRLKLFGSVGSTMSILWRLKLLDPYVEPCQYCGV
jgi:hypothetical protein